MSLLLASAAAALALAPAAAAAWGGPVTASTGETVHVTFSDAIPVDEDLQRRWAEYLVSLPHGAEIAEATLYLAPFREVRRTCGLRALGCYVEREELIVAPVEDVPGAASAEAIVAHEYGHHLAANRLNPPWRGLTHGTKRWASYVGVCAGLAAMLLGTSYETDPGEIFAESYRVLAERRLGREPSPWTVVLPQFLPDERALALLEQDIVNPWRGTTVLRLAGRARVRVHHVATPLDGRFTVTLRAPRTAVFRLSLAGVGAALARGGARVSLATTVCGTRRAVVRVERLKGRGSYSLTVSRP